MLKLKKQLQCLAAQPTRITYMKAYFDLHKPYVDDMYACKRSGKPMKRVPDLIDVWFDSGAMPYAQWHFPFENKETFEQISRQISLLKVWTRPVVGSIPCMRLRCIVI
jgi:isoleucyl-tRNA synthetase